MKKLRWYVRLANEDGEILAERLSEEAGSALEAVVKVMSELSISIIDAFGIRVETEYQHLLTE